MILTIQKQSEKMANTDIQHYELLAQKWLNGTINDMERAEFMQWYNSMDDGKDIEIPSSVAETEASHRERIFAGIQQLLHIEEKTVAPVPALRRRHWWAAAAILLVLLGGGLAWVLMHQGRQEPIAIALNDVLAPQSSKATITLGNGQKVLLDSLAKGQLATQGNIKIVKLANGTIAYQIGGKTISGDLLYNTLENPIGSQVAHLTLADGTQVWLNAGSSLRYPVVFAGKERKVDITGEAYLEVAHNAAKPFTVSKGELAIRVLGTHFNINTYPEEGENKVTLLQGLVRVSKGNNVGMLHPGQQAQVGQQVHVVRDVNLEAIMAWKEGRFVFDRKDIHTTMRQIARWYDVDVEYKGNVTGFFSGSISRQENASQVLKMLALTGEAHFSIQGKKVIVSQ